MTPFEPHLTPVEMMEMGVFGGSYFAFAKTADFDGMDGPTRSMATTQRGRYQKKLNCFGVRSGDSLAEWTKNGWITPQDPLGWFHWYCRYHAGRRDPSDGWQIGRWANYVKRWGLYARNQTDRTGECSPVVKQGLLHWSYLPVRVLLPQ
jgi:hypothetical protein